MFTSVDIPPAGEGQEHRTGTSTAEGNTTRQGEAPAEGRTTRSVDDSEAGVRAKPVALDLAYMLGDLPSLPLSFLILLPSPMSQPSSSALSSFPYIVSSLTGVSYLLSPPTVDAVSCSFFEDACHVLCCKAEVVDVSSM
jgi:hypothetical protein